MSDSVSRLRRELNPLAYRQAGFFTSAQALDLGYSYQAQKHHADAGNWVRIEHGLYRLADWPEEPGDEFVRSVLWSRGEGVVSHDSALAVHGLSDVDPVQIHLTVPPRFRRRSPQIALHYGEVSEADRDVRRGWVVTTPLRTLVDVAAGDISQEIVDMAVADALESGTVTRRRLLRRTASEPERPALRLERALSRFESNE